MAFSIPKSQAANATTSACLAAASLDLPEYIDGFIQRFRDEVSAKLKSRFVH